MTVAQQKKTATRNGFKTGEYIVYPAHGVGQIFTIEEQVVAGHKLELFVIDFLKDKMRLKVPVAKAQSIGMRRTLSSAGCASCRAVRASSAPCGRAGRRNMTPRSIPVI
jgi:RNA polymerase-interacting CarD/CdnL/TRCF family regulator